MYPGEWGGGDNGLEGSPKTLWGVLGPVRLGRKQELWKWIRGIRKDICAHAAFDYLNNCNVAVMLCLLLLGRVSIAFLIIVGESRNQLSKVRLGHPTDKFATVRKSRH